MNTEASASNLAPVPVIVIGITRPTAVGISELFTAHNATQLSARPYRVAAVLDFFNTEHKYQYTAHNLGVVLHTLSPRPQALVTGSAIADAYLPQIGEIWGEYENGVIRKETNLKNYLDATDGSAVWVQMSKTHRDNGPPPPGAMEEVLRQLDAVFRS